MKTLYGYIYDGWNSLLYAIEEIGKAIDEAWGGDDD